jgi:uncharacterized protein (DUF2384 family)
MKETVATILKRTIMEKLDIIFGAPEKSVEWLVKPHRNLEQRSPLEACETLEGACKVLELVQRIEKGVL